MPQNAVLASDDEVRALLDATPLGAVNPGYPTAGTAENCGHVAVTADRMLAALAEGQDAWAASAVRCHDENAKLSGPMFPEMYRRKPVEFRATVWSRAQPELLSLLAEPGSRALLWRSNGRSGAHVVNAANLGGKVYVVDAQSRKPADLSGSHGFFAVRTDGRVAEAVPFMFRRDGSLHPYWQRGDVLARYRSYWGHSMTRALVVCRNIPRAQRLRIAVRDSGRRGLAVLHYVGMSVPRTSSAQLGATPIVPRQRTASEQRATAPGRS